MVVVAHKNVPMILIIEVVEVTLTFVGVYGEGAADGLNGLNSTAFFLLCLCYVKVLSIEGGVCQARSISLPWLVR